MLKRNNSCVLSFLGVICSALLPCVFVHVYTAELELVFKENICLSLLPLIVFASCFILQQLSTQMQHWKADFEWLLFLRGTVQTEVPWLKFIELIAATRWTYRCIQLNDKPCVCGGHPVVPHDMPTETKWMLRSSQEWMLLLIPNVFGLKGAFLSLFFYAYFMWFRFYKNRVNINSWLTLFWWLNICWWTLFI